MYQGEHDKFLFMVQDYITEHPDAAPMVTDFIRRGIQQALQQTQERACDMEVALTFALNPKMKGATTSIIEKIMKWNGKSALAWDSELQRLVAKQSKESA